MCRALDLSPSGYYDWLKRPPSERSQRDDELRNRIRTIWSDSLGTYGRPRIHAVLREEGVRVSQKRVARLMKSMGLRAGGPCSTVGRYPPEFKEQIVELVKVGRSPGSLAREFAPSEQTIRNWVRQSDLDEGRRSDGLATEVRKELVRLKRDNRRLKIERDILKRAVAWVCARGRLGAKRTKALPR